VLGHPPTQFCRRIPENIRKDYFRVLETATLNSHAIENDFDDEEFTIPLLPSSPSVYDPPHYNAVPNALPTTSTTPDKWRVGEQSMSESQLAIKESSTASTAVLVMSDSIFETNHSSTQDLPTKLPNNVDEKDLFELIIRPSPLTGRMRVPGSRSVGSLVNER